MGSRGAVIVNEEDVLSVESHISPAAAYAVVNEIEALTDKPVRYVVNTHFHFDHAHGNQIYPEDVHAIGHEVTREMLETGASLGRSYAAAQTTKRNSLSSIRVYSGIRPDKSSLSPRMIGTPSPRRSMMRDLPKFPSTGILHRANSETTSSFRLYCRRCMLSVVSVLAKEPGT